jgi:chromosome partitioning protein
MIITLLAKKGGVGKSTACILLHEAFRRAGRTVAIQDWDAQGTSNRALAFIGGQRAEPDAAYEVHLFDTPPNLEHAATAAAVRSADIAVVVTSPAPADLWEAAEAVKFAKEKNPDAAVRVLLNKVRRNTILGKLVDESAKDLGAPVLPVNLTARECYQHAVGQGWNALDGAAREEVFQLAVALMGIHDGIPTPPYPPVIRDIPDGTPLPEARVEEPNQPIV